MSKEKQNALSKALKSFGQTIASLFTFGQKKQQLSVLEEEAVMSPAKLIIRNFFRNKLALIGLIGFIGMLLFVFVGSMIRPLDIYAGEAVLKNLPPSSNFLKFPKELEKVGVRNISGGRSFATAVDNNGKVHVWGTDLSGVKNIPDELNGIDIVKVTAGDQHIVALSSTGTVYAWGRDNHKQGSVPPEISQVLMMERVVDIGAGDLYTSVLTAKGNLYSWGSTLATKVDIVPTAYRNRIIAIEPNSMNLLVLLDDYTVGYVGLGNTQISQIPEELKDGSVKVVAIAGAIRTGVALDDQGTLHGWGDSGANLLAIPEEINPNNPNRVKVVHIEAGARHFNAMDENGKIYNWGADMFDQAVLPDKLKDIKFEQNYASYYSNYAVDENGKVYAWGLKGFTFGTDQSGRDILTRLMHGGRISMTVGFVAVIIATFLGVAVGLIAGFYGKWLDNLLMRFAEIVSSFPFLPLVITLSSFLREHLDEGQRILMVMVILGVLSWPGLARLVRGQILAEREKDFVLAARALGIKPRVIIVRHILPNVFNVILVSMTLSYAGTLLTEAGLSFLGFGVLPPSPSWGNMLTGAQASEVIEFYWWRWILPAIAVLLAALSINLVGDGLNEAMDPKSSEK
ncbi:MAG: ABC transporter permease subunit [Erysipelothrix sp.]|nr:ABC transporter permease subunit [Erysipelothrix sp.]